MLRTKLAKSNEGGVAAGLKENGIIILGKVNKNLILMFSAF